MKNNYKPFKLSWLPDWMYKPLLWIMAFGIVGSIVNAVIKWIISLS